MSCIVPKWVTVFDKAYEDLQIPEEDQPEIPENKVIEAESF